MQTLTHEEKPTEQDILEAFRKLTPTHQKALLALLLEGDPRPLLLAHQDVDQIQDLVRVLMPNRIE